MRLYLAGLEGIYKTSVEYLNKEIKNNNIYILTSFYYKNSIQFDIENINKNNLLLDSGAFTFISNGINMNIDKYTDEYIDYINKNNIEQFFEMDIDTILGYEKVKELRNRIEKRTNKQCIPVWHLNRGIEEFKKHCEEYKYIAIGGLAAKHIKGKKAMNNIKEMIKYANKHNVKVHLLGYSKKDLLEFNSFSCDSTSWNQCRFGSLWNYNKEINQPYKQNRDKNKRIKKEHLQEIYLHNIKVWHKYQKYLKTQGYWKE